VQDHDIDELVRRGAPIPLPGGPVVVVPSTPDDDAPEIAEAPPARVRHSHTDDETDDDAADIGYASDPDDET
jgi:hypothetical protein